MEQDTLSAPVLVTKLSSSEARRGLLSVQLSRRPRPAQAGDRATARHGEGRTDRLVFVGSRARTRTSTACHRPHALQGARPEHAVSATGRPSCPSPTFHVDAFDWSTAAVADLDAILYRARRGSPLPGDRRAAQGPPTTNRVRDVYEREYKRFIDPLLKVVRTPAPSCSVRPSAARSSPRGSRVLLRAPAPAPGPQPRLVVGNSLQHDHRAATCVVRCVPVPATLVPRPTSSASPSAPACRRGRRRLVRRLFET